MIMEAINYAHDKNINAPYENFISDYDGFEQHFQNHKEVNLSNYE